MKFTTKSKNLPKNHFPEGCQHFETDKSLQHPNAEILATLGDILESCRSIINEVISNSKNTKIIIPTVDEVIENSGGLLPREEAIRYVRSLMKLSAKNTSNEHIIAMSLREEVINLIQELDSPVTFPEDGLVNSTTAIDIRELILRNNPRNHASVLYFNKEDGRGQRKINWDEYEFVINIINKMENQSRKIRLIK